MYKVVYDFNDNSIILTKDEDNNFEDLELEANNVYAIFGGLECYISKPEYFDYAIDLFKKHFDDIKKNMERAYIIEDYD